MQTVLPLLIMDVGRQPGRLAYPLYRLLASSARGTASSKPAKQARHGIRAVLQRAGKLGFWLVSSGLPKSKSRQD
jgi:hypothetical protein